jgi:hypothetical protein
MPLWRWASQQCGGCLLRSPAAPVSAKPLLANCSAAFTCRALSTHQTEVAPLPTTSSPHGATHPHESVEGADNLSRIRTLLSEVSRHDASVLFPDVRLPRRREVWPECATTASPPSPTAPSSPPLPVSTSSEEKYNSSRAIRSIQQQQQQQQEIKEGGGATNRRGAALRWYGSPPGVIRDVDYFTGGTAAQCNTFFHVNYFLQNKATAPLLRCPACTAHLLKTRENHTELGAEELRTGDSRMPTSAQLWMDPSALDRHLSWAHADQLYTPQELSAYNDQVLHELMYSCGLASLPSSKHRHTHESVRGGADGRVEEESTTTTPARLIFAVDEANVEISSSGSLLEVLTSADLCRTLSQVPVAFCATHELFVPFASKTLHVLYQLALLHPASTLHVFVAHASLESGDMMMSAYVNELMLASPSRVIPPVVLVTRDGQQRQVAVDMHGTGQRTLAPVGVVRGSSITAVTTLYEDVRAALVGGFWSV